MNTGGEMLFPEGNEGRNAALETEAAQNAAQLERCGETELMGPPEMEMLEQQEMDKFVESSRIGDYRIVHYPPEGEVPSMERRGESQRLGEYRIFCDTHPKSGGYDIFADGKGK